MLCQRDLERKTKKYFENYCCRLWSERFRSLILWIFKTFLCELRSMKAAGKIEFSQNFLTLLNSFSWYFFRQSPNIYPKKISFILDQFLNYYKIFLLAALNGELTPFRWKMGLLKIFYSQFNRFMNRKRSWGQFFVVQHNSFRLLGIRFMGF